MRFCVFFTLWYMAINALFALGYLALGPVVWKGAYAGPLFWRAFFFSIHTFATIGYGNIVPVSFLANLSGGTANLVRPALSGGRHGIGLRPLFTAQRPPAATAAPPSLPLIAIRPAFKFASSTGGAAS